MSDDIDLDALELDREKLIVQGADPGPRTLEEACGQPVAPTLPPVLRELAEWLDDECYCDPEVTPARCNRCEWRDAIVALAAERDRWQERAIEAESPLMNPQRTAEFLAKYGLCNVAEHAELRERAERAEAEVARSRDAETRWAAELKRVREVAGAGLENLRAQLARSEAEKNGAYLERNRVVAALAKCFPSGTARTAIEGWSEDWHGCVYIDLPTGQVSWHYHDSQAYLFADLPPYTKPWDGHSTEEKYARVAALTAASDTRPCCCGWPRLRSAKA